MTVPYTFANTPAGTRIPLSQLDSNFAALGSSVNSSYQSTLTGSVARTVASKLGDTISVKDFGATGDGVTDDTAAIQAAINSIKPTNGTVPDKGGIIFFPPGRYIVSSTINTYSGIILEGSGYNTIMNATAGLTNQIFQLNTVDVNVQYIYGGICNMSFVNSGTCWAIKAATALVLNCEFSNLYFYGSYGLSLGAPAYTQATDIDNLVSRGNIEQIFCLTGNFNRIGTINKEGGTGTNTDPYIRLFGGLGLCVGNNFSKLLIEGAGSVNKVPIKLEQANGITIDAYWNELSATNGNTIELDNSSAQFLGFYAPASQAYGKVKLINGSSITFNDFPANHEDLDWQSYLDISSDSVCYMSTVYGRRGQDVYKVSTPDNIKFGRYINTNLLATPAAGYSAQSFPNYVSGQNLLINPSFEAGEYAWSVSSGDVPTFPASEIGQGLMFQCVSTTGFQLTQSVTIGAGQVGQPMTLRFVAKITGSGFLIPIIASNGDLGRDRIAVGEGWEVMTVTYRPQTSGNLSFGLWWVGLSGSSTLYVDEFGLAFGAEALVNTSKFGSFELNQKTVTFASAAPTTGTWKLGDTVLNSQPSTGEYQGWTCTVAGTPGTWEGFGVIALAGPTGSSNVGFLQAGTGAVSRSVQAKLRDTVSVKDFGAVGNGIADDTAAIQAAVDYVKSVSVNLQYTGSTVYVNAAPTVVFPSGVYRISSTISLTNNKYIRFVGDGKSLLIGSAATTKTVTAFSATDLRYLYVDRLQFQNFNKAFDVSTGNLDFSMWSFVDCQADAINLFLDSGSYAASRSTFVEFTRFLCQYGVVQLAKSFCDILTFNDCWLGHGNLSSLIYANSLVTVNGGAFIPSGSTSQGKCFIYLTNDNGAGGTVGSTETERGVHINGARSSNEGGNGPLIVCDYPIVNDYRQNPVVSITDSTLACYHPSQYESGGTETGVIHLKQYPAYVSFKNCGPNAIGADTAKLVSAQSTLSSDAHKSFGIYLDDATLKAAEWAVGELNTYTIAGVLRQYINNPDPAIFRGILENGFLDVNAATTSGIFKSTFTVNTGYTEADYITPITFMLVLMGQSNNALPNLGYGGSSTYIVTISGIFDTALKSSISSTKLHGPNFGVSSADNANIVSLHFGSAETGLTTAAMATTQTITVTFGAGLGFGKARIVNLVPKSQRYGTYPS